MEPPWIHLAIVPPALYSMSSGCAATTRTLEKESGNSLSGVWSLQLMGCVCVCDSETTKSNNSNQNHRSINCVFCLNSVKKRRRKNTLIAQRSCVSMASLSPLDTIKKIETNKKDRIIALKDCERGEGVSEWASENGSQGRGVAQYLLDTHPHTHQSSRCFIDCVLHRTKQSNESWNWYCRYHKLEMKLFITGKSFCLWRRTPFTPIRAGKHS